MSALKENLVPLNVDVPLSLAAQIRQDAKTSNRSVKDVATAALSYFYNFKPIVRRQHLASLPVKVKGRKLK